MLLVCGCATQPIPDAAEGSGDSTAGDPSGSSDAPVATSLGSGESSSGGSTADDGTTGEGATGEETTGEPIPPGFVPAFVAQGHMGRTTISCDEGRTWIADQSLDDGVRCFEGIDCDHHEGAGTGITFGDGVIVATWGWGTEGRVQTSEDGVEWTDVLTGPTFAGTAYGNGVFVAGARSPWRGSASGEGWVDLGDSGLTEWTPRGTGFVPYEGGLFVIGGGGGGTSDLVLSASDGDDWWHPEAFPAQCGDSIRGITYGAGAIVIARGGDGTADLCVSSDGGQHFDAIDLAEAPSGPPLWSGDELVVFSSSTRFTSLDGSQWSGQPITPGVSLGSVARSSQGTYVAQRDGWLVWYEQQELYRSEDGLSWETLAPGTFAGSHPIRHIRAGYLRPHEGGCS